MLINTTYRSEKEEIMDDFLLTGETLRKALNQIAAINRFLGGNKVTLQGVKKLIQTNNTITILDVGCGNGDMLRFLADYGKKHHIKMQLIGIDANNFTIDYAVSISKNYTNISYLCIDIFSKAFNEIKSDIVLCTLTLHHFKSSQIDALLQTFVKQARIGIVINDLHRSIIAYRLFQLVCLIFKLNSMSKNDGLVSILRGFKKHELLEFSKQNALQNVSIQWKWAFRYQWIIKSNRF